MKNHLLLMLTSVFCIFGLGACNNAFISWSPDGNTLAFIGDDGLHLSDAGGQLSAALGRPECVAWLPDSKRLLTANSFDVQTWLDATKYLTERNQNDSMQLSKDILRQLELHGFEGLNNEKLEKYPSFIVSSALLYLKDTEGTHLNAILGKKMAPLAQQWKLKIHTLSLRDASLDGMDKEIWHGFGDTFDARVSPNGKFILFVQEHETKSDSFDLEILSLESAAVPVKIAEVASKHAEWSIDSRKVIFIKAANKEEGFLLGSLSIIEAVGENGSILEKFAAPTDLVYLAVNRASDIRCLKDGKILFTAPDVQLPAVIGELSGKENVFTFKPGDQFARSLISRKECAAGVVDVPLQVNSNDTWVILGHQQFLRILNIATGRLEQIAIDPELAPCWRNADELCFAMPVQGKQSNTHDAEIVLHSMSTGKDRIISANWPKRAVTDILIHKKKE